VIPLLWSSSDLVRILAEVICNKEKKNRSFNQLLTLRRSTYKEVTNVVRTVSLPLFSEIGMVSNNLSVVILLLSTTVYLNILQKTDIR